MFVSIPLFSIPWDVWLAALLAAATLCAEYWQSPQTGFAIIYLMLCAYIVVSIIADETGGE